MTPIWLIAKSVLIEAIRRKEIYAIVLMSTLLIGAVMTVDFFELTGLVKFYREIALRIMSTATALTVIVLAARQLPREFETRTIYPLLAKPISRMTFLFGKLLGVMCAAGFCFALFMGIYIAGSFYLGGAIPVGIFLQYIYLQMVLMLILATLSFWLSMLLNLDAAITCSVIFFIASSTMSAAFSYLYDYSTSFGQTMIKVLTFTVPQLTLFDLSEKAVHATIWPPIPAWVMGSLTLYGGVYAAVFFGAAIFVFSRRAL